MTGKRLTLQDLIRRRQAGAFVGRQKQLAFFEESLALPVDDLRRRFLFSIHGDAGIGKTYLVRQLVRLARENSYQTAYVDESVYDMVSALEAIASGLEQQGASFKGLRSKIANYRERRSELDVDPGTPDGLSSLLTRSAVRISLRAAGDIPFVGALAEEVDSDDLAEQVDRLRMFLSRRFRSDDVQLLLNPVDSLTPVFLHELNATAELRPIALFFDTYERTAVYLETWLIELLFGARYGDLPGNMLICISGQLVLDVNRWGDYLGLIADMPLEIFTEVEARSLLADRGVTDERVIEVILRLSGRLPLLVAMLAEARPGSPELVGDPSGNAVERFLKWEPDERRRSAALHGALLRRLDRDSFVVATNSSSPRDDFMWLCRLPFVTEHADGFRYHDFVRSAMQRVLRRTAPSEWRERNKALADYYAAQRGTLGLSGRTAWADDRWQELILEEQYHRLCAYGSGSSTAARAALVTAIAWRRDTLQKWEYTFEQAGEETGTASFTRLAKLLAAWSEGATAQIRLLSELANDAELDQSQRGTAYGERGRIHMEQGDIDRALADYSIALELNPNGYWIARWRGYVHQRKGDYDAAIRDFDQALEIQPGYRLALTGRGMTYALMGQFEGSLADFSRAIELYPDHRFTFVNRGFAYDLMRRYNEALADYSRAIEIDPKYTLAITSRGITYRSMGLYDDALADFNRAIELDPTSDWAFTNRGNCHRLAGRLDDALADFNRAVELDPTSDWAITHRGEVHHQAGRLDDALSDFNRAIELDPEYKRALMGRGETHRLAGRLDEALVDFNRVIDLDPSSDWAISKRGELHRLAGRLDDALVDFNRAIELNPKYRWALTGRGETHRLAGRLDEALADFNRAIELDRKIDGEIDSWRAYQVGICMLLKNDSEQAQEYLQRAVEIERSALTSDSLAHNLRFNLAAYLLAKGDRAAAEHELQFAFEAQPSVIPLTDALVDFADLNRALSIDTSAIVERIRQAINRTGVQATSHRELF